VKARHPLDARNGLPGDTFVMLESIQSIAKPAIRPLVRRGGVKRIRGGISEEIRCVLRHVLKNMVCDSVTSREYAGMKILAALDVVYFLMRQGTILSRF
jgi:histone H4